MAGGGLEQIGAAIFAMLLLCLAFVAGQKAGRDRTIVETKEKIVQLNEEHSTEAKKLILELKAKEHAYDVLKGEYKKTVDEARQVQEDVKKYTDSNGYLTFSLPEIEEEVKKK